MVQSIQNTCVKFGLFLGAVKNRKARSGSRALSLLRVPVNRGRQGRCGYPQRVWSATHFLSGRKNFSGASFGTWNGVADFSSEVNRENVDGLSLKCFSSVVILV